MTSRTTLRTTTTMSRTAETCRAQRYSDGGWRSSVMPADGEQSPVHEPGDDDGTADEAEAVAGCAEDDEFEGAHQARRAGRAWGTRPARHEWRRGGRPCTSSVYETVRWASTGASYGCSGSRTDVGCTEDEDYSEADGYLGSAAAAISRRAVHGLEATTGQACVEVDNLAEVRRPEFEVWLRISRAAPGGAPPAVSG